MIIKDLLEPLLSYMRMRKVLPVLQEFPKGDAIDIGCGSDFRLIKCISKHVASATGIDKDIVNHESGNVKTLSVRLDSKLPFENSSYDIVTMLAVLEHLDNPYEILCETQRILKLNGYLVITVPSHRAKPVLEFLAFKIGVVSKIQILDHKRYYSTADLEDLISKVGGFKVVHNKTFQFGMNNYLVVRKIQ